MLLRFSDPRRRRAVRIGETLQRGGAAQAAPSKVRSPRQSSMGSIRDPCENPARRDPDPATFVPPLAYPCASPLATAVRYRLEGCAQDTVEHDRTEIARSFCP